jgi:hypothetical protein
MPFSADYSLTLGSGTPPQSHASSGPMRNVSRCQAMASLRGNGHSSQGSWCPQASRPRDSSQQSDDRHTETDNSRCLGSYDSLHDRSILDRDCPHGLEWNGYHMLQLVRAVRMMVRHARTGVFVKNPCDCLRNMELFLHYGFPFKN